MTNRARAATLSVVGRALFVVLFLLLAGCQSAAQEAPETTASRPAMAVRHDTDELARTFPALGAPVSASWIRWDNSGTASQATAVWIDAVVTVTPATMDTLLRQHVSEPTEHRPAVQKVLEADLPPGPFRTGVELNMAFSPGRMSTRVFLDAPRNAVVLQSYDLR
ncbi:MAG: hypothetical protein PGN37_01375 [Mycobacterium kyogaense]|uniref:hypothetical protein n=1 Tax=Mycobacterium kyogaense TaxID=2212479 RepID=UPI002FFCFD32